jgi:hypothetical protein
MILENLEGFAIMKSFFMEPFKGGSGGGGGGGRGGSSRRNNDIKQSPYYPVFIIFIILYSLTFLYSTSKTK